jgi:DNA-directed RNA polymerase subunit omega
MLKPSIDKLLTKVDSKYRLVHIAAKRAQLIQEGDELLLEDGEYVSYKSIGKALEEFSSEKITY